jgi:hypothetical protein
MPEIMSASEFKTQSSKLFARRRNPLIRDLDKLLAVYHGSGGNPRRQLKVLVLIYVWCKQYLHAGGTRGGVGALLQQVETRLKNPGSELTLQMAHQGVRSKGGAAVMPASSQGKSMGQGYRMEPMLPGKGSVGGVQLQSAMKRINTPVLRGLFEDKIIGDLDKANQQYTMKDVIRQAEEAMAVAPITEFLDIYVAFTETQAYADRADFEYCTRDTRSQYRVHIDPNTGQFFEDAAYQVPYTTDIAGKGWGLYAFDTSYRMYVKPSQTIAADGAFNHSSFLSGKPVACAGAIEVDPGGRLRSISNESGHYRPTPGDLGHMLAVLHDEFSVDLGRVEAVVSTAGGKNALNGVACMGIYRNYPKSRLADF